MRATMPGRGERCGNTHKVLLGLIGLRYESGALRHGAEGRGLSSAAAVRGKSGLGSVVTR